MVEKYIGELKTIKLVQVHEIGILIWEDLYDNVDGIAQYIGENFIESNMLFICEFTNEYNGEDALIEFNTVYDGKMTVNFNTYLSEN